MKVLFRFKGLTAYQHRDLLLATDECGSLWPAIEYKSSTHDKEGYTVDLAIEQFLVDTPAGTDRTNREAVDKLWDILGIFPPAQKFDPTFNEIRFSSMDLQNMNTAAMSIQRNVGVVETRYFPRSSVSAQPRPDTESVQYRLDAIEREASAILRLCKNYRENL